MPDLFSEVELGEQRPKDALGGGGSGSSVSLARASGDPLVDLHEGGRSNRGEGTGDAPANAPSSSAAGQSVNKRCAPSRPLGQLPASDGSCRKDEDALPALA